VFNNQPRVGRGSVSMNALPDEVYWGDAKYNLLFSQAEDAGSLETESEQSQLKRFGL
jgi:hypothetical protein